MPLSFAYCDDPFYTQPTAQREYALRVMRSFERLPAKDDASGGALWKAIKRGVSSEQQIDLDKRGYCFVLTVHKRVRPPNWSTVSYVIHVRLNSRVLAKAKHYLLLVDYYMGAREAITPVRIVKASAPHRPTQPSTPQRPINNPFSGTKSFKPPAVDAGVGTQADGLYNNSEEEGLYNNNSEEEGLYNNVGDEAISAALEPLPKDNYNNLT